MDGDAEEEEEGGGRRRRRRRRRRGPLAPMASLVARKSRKWASRPPSREGGDSSSAFSLRFK